jgi:hypothetical protein
MIVIEKLSCTYTISQSDSDHNNEKPKRRKRPFFRASPSSIRNQKNGHAFVVVGINFSC